MVVNGDTTRSGFAMSPEDAGNLKNNVSVFINMAANVRFDLPIKTAINMNTKGTANAIAFAKQVRAIFHHRSF